MRNHVISNHGLGAFAGTDLEDYHKKAGVTQVALVGIASSIGVESTARQAYDLGFNVSLVLDAMTDSNAEAHEFSIARIFPRLGQLVQAQQVIDMIRAPHVERCGIQ